MVTADNIKEKIIRQLVATHFDVSVHDLDIFYKDGPEKLMCCFLLFDILEYSNRSIAVAYKINPLYLSRKISEYYRKALIDKAFFLKVQSLKNAFFLLTKLQVNYA